MSAVATTPMLWGEDTPRARRSDSRASHKAADRSADTRQAVGAAVVALLSACPRATGKELNAAYASQWARRGWPEADFDSPRKRAGELAKDGVLTILNPDDPRGTAAVYALAVTS